MEPNDSCKILSLKDKVAIVTGAGSGIGQRVALRLAEFGAKVACCDVDVLNAKKTVEKIKSMGRESIAVKVDVASIEEVYKMVELTLEKFNRIDILVNNAGILGPSKVKIYEISEREWDMVMNVNLKGMFNCIKAVANTMKKQRYGKIINVSSIAGKIGSIMSNVAYAVSKAGVICLTKQAATELAEYGINVNAIAPHAIKTPMTEKFFDELGDKIFAQWGGILIKRPGTPEDVANLILFLASDASSFITGQTIHINGGAFMSD